MRPLTPTPTLIGIHRGGVRFPFPSPQAQRFGIHIGIKHSLDQGLPICQIKLKNWITLVLKTLDLQSHAVPARVQEDVSAHECDPLP